MRKIRLDERVVALGLAADLETARRLIMAGEIRTGDRVWDKAGQKVAADQPLEHRPRGLPWVSRGGRKLARALAVFAVPVAGAVCLDIGASTGGFTDVLLQAGAAAVTALDVGYGLLDARLRADPRVTVRERTNFRTLPVDAFPQPFDLVVTDVSFISLRLIVPHAFAFLRPAGAVIALIKPQFEAPPDQVEPGGLVRDPAVHRSVIEHLQDAFAGEGICLHGLEPAPIVDEHKNVEYLSLWRRGDPPAAVDIGAIVGAATARPPRAGPLSERAASRRPPRA
ncbi:MAG: RNA binding methyltransferase FtsJ like [Candidatus Ozemobacter sibiricus]|uniref:RNA binding methyltransferase FtsJ like n=1 Tax=Candidatus Ozemobacter sibiricus TaxID=2268124 RepID=A0A367ZIX6_9BACT|nr:MAG: RNA binding methyltransferase FtsJ like [Candidatus Ozemobacter sibiricus]